MLRLRGLLADAAATLSRHGHEAEAARLTRALSGD